MVLHFSNRFFGGLIFGEGQGTRALINEGGGGGYYWCVELRDAYRIKRCISVY